MSFKIKLFITFIAYGLGLVIFTQLVVFKLQEVHIKSDSIQKAADTFNAKDKYLQMYIKNSNLKLLSIKESLSFKKYLAYTKNIDTINSLFLDIAATNDNIMQLRYLDNEGMEVVRIDRDYYSSKPYLIPEKNLQNKSSRYYFKEILNYDKNGFWYSRIDLNVEHTKIEKPVKPVLRIGIPVFHNDEKKGILIINIFMKKFVEELVDSSVYNIYIFDTKGNILVDSMHKYCWSKYLDDKSGLLNQFPIEFDRIISAKEYYTEDIYSNIISLNNGEDIHILIEPKKELIQKELTSHIYELAWIILAVILFSFPLSYFISATPSRLKEQVDKQKAEQDVLLSLFDLSDAVLFKWNNDIHWSVSFVSKSVTKLIGYSQKDFQTNSIEYANRIHPDDLTQVMEEVSDAVENKVYFFEHKPYRIITKNGDIKWILDSTVILRDEKDNVINFVGYLTDITELKNNELELQNISRTDQLTKISNRMHLDDMLQNQYHRFYRDNEICSVILIDIDYFKSVNDQHGHLIGDSVLIEFASLLSASIRAKDILGRWGGEEFLIILPYTNLSQAMQLAEKLHSIINNHIFGVVKHKTASFGVTELYKGITIQKLLDTADNALYKSKENGRNRITAIGEETDT